MYQIPAHTHTQMLNTHMHSHAHTYMPGIGRNASCAVGDFAQHLGLFYKGDVVLWLFMHTHSHTLMHTVISLSFPLQYLCSSFPSFLISFFSLFHINVYLPSFMLFRLFLSLYKHPHTEMNCWTDKLHCFMEVCTKYPHAQDKRKELP